MLNNVKRVFKKELTKEQIINFVLDLAEHSWIKENQYAQAHMTDFLERLPRKVLHKVFIEKTTLLVRSSGRFACSVSTVHQNVIIIFPEVYELLTKTFDGWAKAVLAHEIGHNYLEHAELKIEDPMEAQVDADTFACEMGYLDQIEAFLHDQPESIEKRVRLSFVTSYYFNNLDH